MAALIIRKRSAELAVVQIRQTRESAMEVIDRALELRDYETLGHTRRVTDLAERMAQRLELTPEHCVAVRWGARLHDIGKLAMPDTILPRYHHERWDGSGYPDGLSGAEIPLGARLFAVIDVFDALISSRPYKHAWSEGEAVRYLTEHAGTQFDPEMVAHFLAVIADGQAPETHAKQT